MRCFFEQKGFLASEHGMHGEGSESTGNIQFIQSDSSQIELVVASVLRHLPAEYQATICESIENSVQRSNLRFAGFRVLTASATEKYPDLSLNSNPEKPADSQPRSGYDDFASAYLQEYPGKLACLVGPASNLGALNRSDITAELVQKLVEIGWSWSVELVQILFESDAPFSRFAVQKAGFYKVANLIQMQVDLPISCLTDSPTSRFSHRESMDWKRYDEKDRSLWIEWLDQTFSETKDCPELNGLRSTESSLEGYLAASRLPARVGQTSGVGPSQEPHDEPAPNWWGGFLNVDGKNSLVAGYLLNPTAWGVWELTYMGVIPSARGRKLGQEVLHRAVETAQKLNAHRLWLAVDERNTAARKLYKQIGFEEARQLEAWIAVPPGKSLA
jgi:ribosomal protein S18 acetylase RimI-like enzyme